MSKRNDGAGDAAGRIAAILARYADDPRTGELLFSVQSGDGALNVTQGDPQRQFFIASATKLFVAAILARYRERGLVDWDAPMVGYLPDLDLHGLHARRGRERTGKITVRHLLAHTSGLADYFGEPRGTKRTEFRSTFDRVVKRDMGWDLAQALAWSREIPPHFAPGARGKAFYSDTNYQLLGAIIERIGGASFAEIVEREVCEPLGLRHTWVFGPDDIGRYDEIATMLHGRRRLRIPMAMASTQADGGIVSTLCDLQRFLRAFFGGELVPPTMLAEMTREWRRIFFPLRYGTGIMQFRLASALTGFRRVPPMVGHSGASGTVVYRCLERDLWMVGTVNQTMQRSLPYKILVQIEMAARG